MDLAARANALCEGIAALPIGPWPESWAARVSGLIRLALEEAVVETRQMILVDVLAALQQANAEEERLAEEVDGKDETGRNRRSHLFGKAKGIARAAGIAAEIINRKTSHANSENEKPQPQATHLVVPLQEG